MFLYFFIRFSIDFLYIFYTFRLVQKGGFFGPGEGESFVVDIHFHVFSIDFKYIFNLFSIDLH